MILETNMKDGTRPESLDVTYIVKGFANPPPVATWTLDDKEIKPGSNLRMTASQNGEEFHLEIKKLDMKDAGVYKCILSNPLGEAKQQAVLEVTRKIFLFTVCTKLKVVSFMNILKIIYLLCK